MTPNEAMKALIELGGEPKVSTKIIEKSINASKQIKEDVNKEQAYSIYETITDYQGELYSSFQKNAATKIIRQMQDKKITPEEAIKALMKI